MSKTILDFLRRGREEPIQLEVTYRRDEDYEKLFHEITRLSDKLRSTETEKGERKMTVLEITNEFGHKGFLCFEDEREAELFILKVSSLGEYLGIMDVHYVDDELWMYAN